MTTDKRNDALKQQLHQRIRTFNRVEQVFYLALVVTSLVMAVSVIYMQIRSQQLKQEITQINTKINQKKEELNDAKQEINELTRLDRITEIVSQVDLKTQSGNLQKVE